MLLFRSEEHVDRWCATTGIPRGESFTIEQGWQLAQALYSDRLSLTWRRKTPAEYEGMFRSAGLTSDFWQLTTMTPDKATQEDPDASAPGGELEWSFDDSTVRRPSETADRPAEAITEEALRAQRGRLPRVIREFKPHYSRGAMERGVEGTVLLEAVVLPDGSTSGIQVKRSLDAELDQLAIAALRRWQFTPATIGARQIPVIITVELKFTLR